MFTSKVYSVGVDLGKQGSWSLLCKEGPVTSVVESIAMPLTKEKTIDGLVIASTLARWQKQFASFNITLEKQFILMDFNKGGKGAFTVGWGAGYIEGIITTLGIPYKVVTAQTWQKVYPLVEIPDNIEKLNIKDTKKKSLSTCIKLFPDVNLFTKRGRALDGLSDSILIANFALNY